MKNGCGLPIKKNPTFVPVLHKTVVESFGWRILGLWGTGVPGQRQRAGVTKVRSNRLWKPLEI